MLFVAQRASIPRVFAPALFHGNARIESSSHNAAAAASTVWFTKVVCTLCVRSSSWLSVFGNDYFRESMDPFVAFEVIHRLNDGLNRPDLAFRFFRHSRLNMNLTHLEPTFNLLLRSTCGMGFIDSAKLIYEYMRADGFLPSSSLLDFVVSTFANAGEFRVAQDVLIATAEICCGKDEIVSPFVYNSFLSLLIGRNRVDEAVSFFKGHVLRLRSFRPDTCSFNIVLRGLCLVGRVETAFELVDVMKSFNCDRDIVTYNTIINGLCRVGKLERAEDLLREVKAQRDFVPDVVTYTSLISGYCKLGGMENAGMLFDEMVNCGVRPNLFTYNAIIDGYGKKGQIDSALRMYQRMVRGGLHPDVVTFTSLINGHCRVGELEQGMKVWDEMNQRKVSPNIRTFSVLISALCEENRLGEARDLMRQLYLRKDIVPPPPFVYNPVVDGFCKSGNVDEANAIVAEMEAKGCVHDKMTYTILILGHCMKGRMAEAIKVYEKMLLVGCAPDAITITSLVSRLRKAGMAREANQIQKKAIDNVPTSCSSSSERAVPNRSNVNITVAV